MATARGTVTVTDTIDGALAVSTSLLYSDLQTSGNVTSNGQWKISTSSSANFQSTGTNNWTTSVVRLFLRKVDGNGVDRESFLNTLEIGDTIKFTSQQTGKTGFAAIELTATPVLSDNVYTFQVRVLQVVGELSTLSTAGGVNVSFGFSRAQSGANGEDGGQGPEGADGFSTANAFIYRRSTAQPTTFPSHTYTYTFSTATGVFSNGSTSNGWSVTIPSGDDTLWVRTRSVASQGATQTVATNAWSNAVALGTEGVDGINGLNAATVSIHRRTTSTSTPARPTNSSTYTFDSGALTALNNSWTREPSGTGRYLWVSQANAIGRNATDVLNASEWSTPQILSIDGESPERPPGRFNIIVSGLPSTAAQCQTAFIGVSYTPSTSVEGDQAWFYVNSYDNPPENGTSAWIKTGSGTNDWTNQTAFVDGNLLVSGSITGSKISTKSLVADEVLAGTVGTSLIDLDGPMIMDADNSAIIAGRSATSANEIDGLYFGRLPNNGFQFSGISSAGGVTQGMTLDNSSGFRLYEPTFYVAAGSETPGFLTYTTSGARTLQAGRLHRIVVLGAGGGGGGGGDDHDDNGTAGNNGTSTTVVISGSPSSNGTYTSTGGLGGAGGLGGDNGASFMQSGEKGFDSFAGSGGNGGNSSGAAGSNGARGAGGGGSAGANFTGFGPRAGEGGRGGRAGQETEIVVDLTGTTNNATINVTSIGIGGTGGREASGSTKTGFGGTGGSGVVYVSNAFGGYLPYDLTSITQGINPYGFAPFTTASQSFFFNNSTHYGPFATRRIIIATMHGNNSQNIDGQVWANATGRSFRIDFAAINDVRQIKAGDSGVAGRFFRSENMPTNDSGSTPWEGSTGSGGFPWSGQTRQVRIMMDAGIIMDSNSNSRSWIVYGAQIIDDPSDEVWNAAFNQPWLGA